MEEVMFAEELDRFESREVKSKVDAVEEEVKKAYVRDRGLITPITPIDEALQRDVSEVFGNSDNE